MATMLAPAAMKGRWHARTHTRKAFRHVPMNTASKPTAGDENTGPFVVKFHSNDSSDGPVSVVAPVCLLS